MEYPKTDNVFTRNPDTHKLTGATRSPAFDQIVGWHVTEKIDGTNIRVVLQWTQAPTGWLPVVTVRGRSDAANLPGLFVEEALGKATEFDLTAHMLNLTMELTERSFEELRIDPISVTVYGEGYGPGIQKGGGRYAPRKSLRIFDVVTHNVVEDPRPYWRPWADVETAARHLEVNTVPVIFSNAPLSYALREVRGGMMSRVAVAEMGDACLEAEGVVARTNPYLFDSRGNRVMWKLKSKDL